RYKSLPLAERLGLKVECTNVGEDTTLEVVNVLGAGYMKAAIEEKGWINLAWRLGNGCWDCLSDPLNALDKLAPGIKAQMPKIPIVLGWIVQWLDPKHEKGTDVR